MKKLLLIITIILSVSVSTDAKWWIFGKSATGVSVKYLYINNIPADEAGGNIKIFKETLPPGGAVKIAGKAATGKGGVGAVRLTLDNKSSWQDVKFADNGTFEHSFTPETGKAYTLFIEITDTAGKTNNVDETRKVIELSTENIQAKVRRALDALFDYYNRENLTKFMAEVGENFAGDKAILERAVKRDFDALSNIVMRYSINNVAAGAQGRVFVSVTYNRLVFINKTGASNTDTGTTEFVFETTGERLSLYSMKQPLMFGLSDAENVATGEVLGNSSALVIDESGNLGSGETVTLSCSATIFPAYTFATGSEACGPGNGDIWFYDDSMPNLIGYSADEHTFASSLASLGTTEVRGASYTASGSVADSGSGYSYCFKIGMDYYCVEMISSKPVTTNETVTFKVKKF